MIELAQGDVAWAVLDRTRGREQSGHRPVLIVSSTAYLDAVTTSVIVLPITSVERGWPNHIRVAGPAGLRRESWIMTEQPRTMSRERVTGLAGNVTTSCFAKVRMRLADFFDL